MQLMEFKVKVLLIFIFQVCPTPNLHNERCIYLITFLSRETFLLLLVLTKLQNKIKMIKSSQNNKYYQKSLTQVKVTRDKSGLLAEIKILLLLDGHSFFQN